MKEDSNNQHTLKEIKNPGPKGDTHLQKMTRKKTLSSGVNPPLEPPGHTNEEVPEEEMTPKTHLAKTPSILEDHLEDHLEDCQKDRQEDHREDRQEDHWEDRQEDHPEEDHQGESPMTTYQDYSEEEGEDPLEEDHHPTPPEDKGHAHKDPSP